MKLVVFLLIDIVLFVYDVFVYGQRYHRQMPIFLVICLIFMGLGARGDKRPYKMALDGALALLAYLILASIFATIIMVLNYANS